MDTNNIYQKKKQSEKIAGLQTRENETANKYHQYRDAYEAVMGDSFQNYSAVKKNKNNDGVLKIISTYENRRKDIHSVIKKLNENADFSMKDAALQEKVNVLDMPLSFAGMEKNMQKLDAAVAQYNRYKETLSKEGTEKEAREYNNHDLLANIMLNTEKLSSTQTKIIGDKVIRAENTQKEYSYNKYSILNSNMSEKEKIFAVRKEKERVDQAWNLSAYPEFSQKYQEKANSFEEAVKEHSEKSDLLLQVANLADKSKGAEKEDPDYTLVLQKATEYITHPDSEQNTEDLLNTMDAVGAYIEKHRHALIGKNRTRRNMMVELQKKLQTCVNATMKTYGKHDASDIGELMKRLNETFSEDGGSEEFRAVMKNMNLMRISGNYDYYAEQLQPIVRKYIASHGNPRMSMGKKRLELMKDLEGELAMYAHKKSIADEEADDKYAEMQENFHPEEAAKERAEYSEKCQKKMPEIEDHLYEYETNVFSVEQVMSPARMIYSRLMELKNEMINGSADIENVNKLYRDTYVALDTETHKYNTVRSLESRITGTFVVKTDNSVAYDKEYLKQSVSILKKTLQLLNDLGAEKVTVSKEKIAERAESLKWYGPFYNQYLDEMNRIIASQKTGNQ